MPPEVHVTGSAYEYIGYIRFENLHFPEAYTSEWILLLRCGASVPFVVGKL